MTELSVPELSVDAPVIDLTKTASQLVPATELPPVEAAAQFVGKDAAWSMFRCDPLREIVWS